MRDPDLTRLDLRNPLATYLLGFFGVLFAFTLLPRTLKFLVRKFFFGFLGEVVTVVITALLTEKAVEALNERND